MHPANVCLLFFCLFFSWPLCAASLAVWPINPRIDAPGSSTMVWVKNNNKNESIILQARVLVWHQVDNQERYEPQDDLVVSPPMIEVKPSSQQIFRIVNRAGSIKDVLTEKSYRLLIDEVPGADAKKKSLLSFQMRYSLPLFIGQPAGYEILTKEHRFKMLTDALRYRIMSGKEPAIEITNTGHIHVRLSGVKIRTGNDKKQDVVISEGLLGYVLPGAARHFPLNKNQLTALAQENTAVVFTQEREELRIVSGQ